MTAAHEPEATLVVPCYNEAQRLDRARFRRLARTPDITILFVDDGSNDDTRSVLEGLRDEEDGKMQLLPLGQNGGKGEAVRAGMQKALADGAVIVGYADADFSTPPGELLRLRDELVRSDAQAVTGARVALLGRDIHRSETRHYLGRIFATMASLVLRTRYYDTQCGAKFFRASKALEVSLSQPFRSRWAFDVELLGRLLAVAEGATYPIVEVPLLHWEDVAGSKLMPTSMAKAALDLARIELSLRKLRARRR